MRFSLIIFAIYFSIGAHAEQGTGYFRVTPFDRTEVSDAVLAKGLRTLFAQDRTTTVDTGPAKAFHARIAKVIERYRAQTAGGQTPYGDGWATGGLLGLPMYSYHDIRFPSIWQRPGNHPSNQVVLRMTVPNYLGRGCERLPTILVVHAATEDSIDGTLRLSDKLAELSNRRISVAHLYLPHFGPRRFLPNGQRDPKYSRLKYDPDEINEDFFQTEDKRDLEDNMLQAILDVHSTIDFLTRSSTGRNLPVALMGISMGAAISLLYEGLEPGRLAGGDAFLVAGSDIAHALDNVIHQFPSSHYSQTALKHGWNEAQLRRKVAPFDPLTWAGRIQNRQFYFLNAQYDQTFVKARNYEPLVRNLGPGVRYSEDYIPTRHNPGEDYNTLQSALHIFAPFRTYLTAMLPAADPECEPQPVTNAGGGG